MIDVHSAKAGVKLELAAGAGELFGAELPAPLSKGRKVLTNVPRLPPPTLLKRLPITGLFKRPAKPGALGVVEVVAGVAPAAAPPGTTLVFPVKISFIVVTMFLAVSVGMTLERRLKPMKAMILVKLLRIKETKGLVSLTI